MDGKKKIERFEDLIAWQKARDLTRKIYEATREGKVSKDFGFCGQIQRSSVSVMSNIAEGFERYSRKEFHQYLMIAKASNAEVRSLLYVGLDVEYFSRRQFDELHASAEEVSRIINALRTSVAPKSGQK